MSNTPVHIVAAAAGGKPYGRRAVWQVVRELQVFTAMDVRLRIPHVKSSLVDDYLALLVRGGFVERGPMVKGMTTTTLYQYDSKTGEFLHQRPSQNRPNGEAIIDVIGATPTAPPADIPAKHVACWTGEDWEITEDHRQTMDEQGRMVDGTGTKYWLPSEGDDFRSEGRYTKELGPLPKEAELERPEKPLSVAQEEKMREIVAAHERALAGAVALNDPTPSTVAVESSLLAVTDAEGLEWVRDQLTIRRAELEAQVQAATSVAAVEAITVSYSV